MAVEAKAFRKAFDASEVTGADLPVPPHSLEAEACVLGSILLDSEVLAEVAHILTADDFHSPAHREVFEAALRLDQRSSPVDLLTVAEELRAAGKLDKVGGTEFLTRLIEITPSPANAPIYARIVADYARLRRLLHATHEIQKLCYEPGSDIGEVIDYAESLVFEVTTKNAAELFVTLHDLLDEALSKLENLYQKEHTITGVPSGFADLDAITAGFQPSNLIVVAARPSMGKTAFVLGLAQHAARATKKAVAIFSLEMSKSELIQRLLAAEAMIDSSHIRTGKLNDVEWHKLMTAAGRLAQDPIYIDDQGAITLMELRAKCRRLAARRELAMVVVDYMQLMEVGTSRREQNRQQDVSEISRGLKLLARELNVPVVAVSQLNRAPEARADKRPLLGDLRESGAIEQDADLVIFLYRDSYYDPESPDRGVAEVIIAKHRNGPTATIKLAFIEACTKFADLAKVQVH
jgi:replicative DNA helicase